MFGKKGEWVREESLGKMPSKRGGRVTATQDTVTEEHQKKRGKSLLTIVGDQPQCR